MRGLSIFRFSLSASILIFTAAAHGQLPLYGSRPLVGLTLTDEFTVGSESLASALAQDSDAVSGNFLSLTGEPHFELALIDTGARFTMVNARGDQAFDLTGNGFSGTEAITLQFAPGDFAAVTTERLGIYVGALNDRSADDPLLIPSTSLVGQINASIGSAKGEVIPNLVGMNLLGQYATTIESSRPQVYEANGRTVRTPNVTFNEIGSGDAAIQLPLQSFSILSLLSQPLALGDGLPTSRRDRVNLNADLREGLNNQAMQFIFDTGASFSMISTEFAVGLGIDLNEPDFGSLVLRSNDVQQVPGFYADSLEFETTAGELVLRDVPFLVVDSPGVPALLGMNAFHGRDITIDPVIEGEKQASVWVSDRVTQDSVWRGSTGSWSNADNWGQAPSNDFLSDVQLQNQAGQDAEILLSETANIAQLRVSAVDSQLTALELTDNAHLTTLGTTTVSSGSEIRLAGGRLDSFGVELTGGKLTGSGSVRLGNGPNVGGIFVQDGELSPGTVEAPIGRIDIEGGLASSNESQLRLDVLGEGKFDAVHSSDTIILGGHLLVEAGTEDLDRASVNVFPILVGEDVQGWFDRVSVNSVPLAVEEGSAHGHVEAGWFFTVEVQELSNVVVSRYVAIIGDANGDGEVGFSDFLLLSNNFGQEADWQGGDFDGTGKVGFADFLALSENFGERSAIVAVPEPKFVGFLATLVLLCCRAKAARRVGKAEA